jgi:hypothetical protein
VVTELTGLQAAASQLSEPGAPRGAVSAEQSALRRPGLLLEPGAQGPRPPAPARPEARRSPPSAPASLAAAAAAGEAGEEAPAGAGGGEERRWEDSEYRQIMREMLAGPKQPYRVPRPPLSTTDAAMASARRPAPVEGAAPWAAVGGKLSELARGGRPDALQQL